MNGPKTDTDSKSVHCGARTRFEGKRTPGRSQRKLDRVFSIQFEAR